MAQIDGPVDGFGKVEVNLPLVPEEAGFAQIAFDRGGGIATTARVTQNGELAVAEHTILFSSEFNGASGGSLINNMFNVSLTTFAATLSAGFLRINSGAVTTANAGYSLQTWETFQIQDGASTIARMAMRHTNGLVANKQFDFGFGYYDIAANQNAAMNEFAGFRWTQAGALIGVLEYSSGGAPTTVTVNINGGVPYPDDITHTYQVIINEDAVEFWVDGVFEGRIQAQSGSAGVTKGSGYPVIVRLFNAVSTPPLAPLFDIGSITVSRRGPANQIPRGTLQVMAGRHALTAQQGIQGASGALSVSPVSGTAPGAVTATNILPALANALGGYFRINGAAIVAAAHTEYLINSFGNPAIPETAGVASNGRALIITDLMISPLVVTAALTGGGFVAEWFVAIGSTGVSLATADGNGGAAVGTKSPKRMPLPIVDSLGAAAAVGTVSSRVGNGLINFETPLVLNPGEFIQIGFRTLQVTALVSAGDISGGIGINGYWQ